MKEFIKSIMLGYIIASIVIYGLVYLANAYYMQDWGYLMHLDVEGRQGVFVGIYLCHILIIPLTLAISTLFREEEE